MIGEGIDDVQARRRVAGSPVAVGVGRRLDGSLDRRSNRLDARVSPTCATWDGFRDFRRSDASQIKELERRRGGFARVVTTIGIDGRYKRCLW